ncbi:hypothetical protein BC936DRAFT_145185 [Jimgerdemannia flammicorona]|uniref:DNA2/NAM7 helicase helicase domain-containing protein n=1 Tax=Jimgerdemannia flammicorona TaxID=994334 RepID=A0A433DAP2_9FUNG|nr:hypothetical protein BC936DRAFT_145185 [Jimgerdemannia flammicorona]
MTSHRYHQCRLFVPPNNDVIVPKAPSQQEREGDRSERITIWRPHNPCSLSRNRNRDNHDGFDDKPTSGTAQRTWHCVEYVSGRTGAAQQVVEAADSGDHAGRHTAASEELEKINQKIKNACGKIPVTSVAPRIIICEEVSEVLESHILVTPTASTQHLILIGDHHQLQPQVATYKLSADLSVSYPTAYH